MSFKPRSGRQTDNRRKVREDVFSKKRLQRSEIASFSMQYFDINEFGRTKPKPRDCVINAMELLQLMDKRSADLMRIMVGDRGIFEGQLVDCFNLVYEEDNVSFQFQSYSNPDTLIKYVKEDLGPNNVIFCGYDDKHVFLIGKGLDGNIYLIDPQLNLPNQMCNMTVGEFKDQCWQFISNKGKYHMLKYHKKNLYK